MRSLRRRLTLLVSLLVVVAVAGTGSLMAVGATRALVVERDRLMAAVVSAAAGSTAVREAEEVDQGAGRCRGIGVSDEVARSGPLWLVDRDGNACALGRDAAAAPPVMVARDGLLRQGAAPGSSVRELLVTVDGAPRRAELSDVLRPGLLRTAVLARAEVVNADVAVLAATGLGDLVDLAIVLGGIAVAAIIASVLVLALVIRVSIAFASSPLVRFEQQVREVAATGDTSRRLRPRRTDDEIGQLAVQFDQMLERLEAGERSRRRLVSDASHELRTPVTSMRANLELLQLDDGRLGAQEREQMLDDITAQAAELSLLVEQLMDAARQQERGLRSTVVDGARLVEDAVERCRRNAPDARVALEVEPFMVRGDVTLLARALNNVLDNAVRFAGPHCAISVTAGGGIVRVQDDGPGFVEADIPGLFERFRRGSGVQSTPGSGLGLAIANEAVAAHGGTLTARTAGDGGGAVVEFVLPTIEGHDGSTAARSAKPQATHRLLSGAGSTIGMTDPHDSGGTTVMDDPNSEATGREVTDALPGGGDAASGADSPAHRGAFDRLRAWRRGRRRDQAPRRGLLRAVKIALALVIGLLTVVFVLGASGLVARSTYDEGPVSVESMPADPAFAPRQTASAISWQSAAIVVATGEARRSTGAVRRVAARLQRAEVVDDAPPPAPGLPGHGDGEVAPAPEPAPPVAPEPVPTSVPLPLVGPDAEPQRYEVAVTLWPAETRAAAAATAPTATFRLVNGSCQAAMSLARIPASDYPDLVAAPRADGRFSSAAVQFRLRGAQLFERVDHALVLVDARGTPQRQACIPLPADVDAPDEGVDPRLEDFARRCGQGERGGTADDDGIILAGRAQAYDSVCRSALDELVREGSQYGY